MTAPAAPQAKEPLTVLAGPYGHPFHPILVTVPIGAWVMSFVFDLASIWSSEPEVFVKGAFWLVGAGVVAALVAALFGLLDLLAIPRGTRAFATGITHLVLNLAVVALLAVSFAVRQPDLEVASLDRTGFVLSIVTLVLLGVSGYLGGRLAYRYGVRVAAEDVQAQGFVRAGRPPAARRTERGRMPHAGPAPG